MKPFVRRRAFQGQERLNRLRTFPAACCPPPLRSTNFDLTPRRKARSRDTDWVDASRLNCAVSFY
eukprot:10757371-Alexandrium_andersonii.AAC.1